MKLYAKVVLGVVLSFVVFFSLMALIKERYITPAANNSLYEASKPGLEFAAKRIARSADPEATLRELRGASSRPLVIEPTGGRTGEGWFARDGHLYTYRQLDSERMLVFGPHPLTSRPEGILAALTIVVPLLLSFLTAYWLVNPLVKRIGALSSVTRRVADGDFGARAKDRGNDAIGDLSRRFNVMADHIERLLRGRQELLQAVSHEFRTPITRMRFELELLGSSHEESERTRRFAAIDESLSEMDELVSELLTYVRFDDAQPRLLLESISPAEVARDIVATIGTLRSEVEVRVTDRADKTIEAHAKYFRRALQNLVVNAIHHARSQIVIEVDQTESLEVSVWNDGAAIPAEARERIFEPFARLDESRSRDAGGVGLGLAIVRRICEWHGASVAAVDCQEGAKFVITWPFAVRSAHG